MTDDIEQPVTVRFDSNAEVEFDWQVAGFRLTEGFNEPFELTVELFTTDLWADPTQMLGCNATISLERGEATWTLLRFEPRSTTHELLARWVPGADEPGLAGRVMAYWSPDGERVLLVIEVDARPTGEPPLQERRWVLRAVGPQIRLVEAGAGQARMRELAAGFAAAGLPIANAQLRAQPVATSQLLHAQGHGDAAAVAERVRELLPLPLTPEATRLKRDHGDVVVILGYDAQ